MHRTLQLLLVPLTLGWISGCAGESTLPTETTNDTNEIKPCEVSLDSGTWLMPFGPIRQSLISGGQGKVNIILMQGARGETKGSPLQNQAVAFKLITPHDAVSLDRTEVVTDDNGRATALLLTETQLPQGLYQVEASFAGTCAQTFTFDVRPPLRQLRAITPSPYDTFTGARIPLIVEASTNGNAKIVGEDITFSIASGKTAETTISPVDGTTVDGTGAGETLTVKTNANGGATAMLNTGYVASPQLNIKATMAGTSDVVIQLRVGPGQAAPCVEDNANCPLGYTCIAGACEAPAQLPQGGCTSNNHCQPPTICDINSGQCLEPTGKPCDPIEGTGCADDEICVLGNCATYPAACSNHGECPATFRCVDGDCVPSGRPSTGGCIRPDDCPTNETCVNGVCKPKETCNVPGRVNNPHRLQGTWQFDSKLHLREAIGGFLKGILSLSGQLRDLLEGNFDIDADSFILDFLREFVGELMSQYIPPWGQQLVIALGNLNDIVSDMRVISTVQMTPVGTEGLTDKYSCSEEWTLVEFEYKGQKISSAPYAIPEIGQVQVHNYIATETCGVLYVAKHKVSNTVGGIMKWVIGTALSLAACGVGQGCYLTMDAAINQAVSCGMIAMQLDMLLMSVWSSAPSISGIVEVACEALKTKLLNDFTNHLNGMTTKFTKLELSGTGNVHNDEVPEGTWYGVLDGGNFNGEFKAAKID